MANIRVTLELDDQGYINKIKLAETETAKLGKTAATAGANGAAGVGLLSGAMVGLRAAATAAMAAMAPLLAAAAAFAAIKGAFTLADDITDLAQGSGIAADKIIALRQALQKAGGDADSAGNMITKLTNFLDNAAGGSAEAVNKLAQLGITMQDIRTMSPEQALDATIAALAKMEDPVKRNALAFDLLGKRAANINWKEVQAGTAETTAEQKAQAVAAAKLAEVYDSIGATFTNIQLALIELLAPFADLYDRLSKLNGIGSAFKVVFQGVKILFAALAVTAYALYTAINTVIEGLSALFDAAILAVRGNLGGAGFVLNKFAEDTKSNFADVVKFAEQQFGKLSGVVPAAEDSGGGGGGGGGRAVADPTAKERAKIEGVSEAYQQVNRDLREKLQLEYDNLGVSEEEAKVADARREAQAKANQEIVKLQEQLAGLDMTKATDRSLAGTIRAEIAEIENLVAAEQAAVETTIRSGEIRKRSYADAGAAFQNTYDIESFKRNIAMIKELELAQTEEQRQQINLRYAAEEEYQKALLALRIKYSAAGRAIPAEETARLEADRRRSLERLGAQTAELSAEDARKRRPEYVIGEFARGLNKMTDPLVVLEQSVGSVFNNMTSALDNFVETGKFKFGDFARSVIQDLIKIQMKALAVGIFKSVLGSLFPGANINLPGRARGGPVIGGAPYLVGERGPELFIPSSSGNIIPNNALRSGTSDSMGGPTQVVYNINAVDAPSFKALVAADPQFIYSVTQLGSRSIPR